MATKRTTLRKGKVREQVQQYDTLKGWRYRARVKIGGIVKCGLSHKNRSDAVADRNEMRAAKATTPVRVLTVGEAMIAVLDRAEQRNRRPATITDYTQRFDLLSRWPQFAEDRPLSDITAEDVVNFFRSRVAGSDDPDELGAVAANTALSDLVALQMVVKYGIRKGALAIDPVAQAKDELPAKTEKEMDWFSFEELGDLLDRVRAWPTGRNGKLDPERDANLIELLALSGLRKKESVFLRVSDVNLKRRTLTIRFEVGKRGQRILPIGPDLERVLKYFLAGRDRFPSQRQDQLLPVGYEGTGSMARRWSERLKEPRLHLHALRHSFCTEIARQTGSTLAVMKLSGIKVEAIARRYVHLAGIDVEDVHLSLTPRPRVRGIAR